MSLLHVFDGDLKTALKASDKVRLSVLRLLKSAIKNQQIEKGRELSDEEILSVISSLAKQRKDSIEQFSRGGREDLADQERLELSILQSYMPQQLSAEEIERMIVSAIQESGAKDEKDLGKVMRILMPRLKGLADGKTVNNRARELLQSAEG
ncbi:MAG: GatB/YqeY domain-containing protein [Nitrospirae bacterium]|nr:GatB/YqeY domain-containing protein [Nitrospirota bacterium]